VIKRTKIYYLITLFIIYGCAGTTGSIHDISPTAKNINLCTRYKNLEIIPEKDDSIFMQDHEIQRIINLVIHKIKTKNASCFQKIFTDDSNSIDTDDTLLVRVRFTRYEKGNAFARFMLAGLGQMHIDAMVTLINKDNNNILGKYKVTKTFAWGGIYGGSRGIEDIEPAFAEAVANTILKED